MSIKDKLNQQKKIKTKQKKNTMSIRYKGNRNDKKKTKEAITLSLKYKK